MRLDVLLIMAYKLCGRGVELMNSVARFLQTRLGATAAEYALILGIIGAAIAVGAYALGVTVGGEMNEAADCVEEPSTC